MHKNFKLKKEEFVKDINSKVFFLEHIASGAQVVHIANDDEENAFCFGFKTLPENSKGIPHIIEHCVLAGSCSKKMKDGFFELSKSSVSTYLNAFTYPEETMYVSSTPNKKDFRRIVDYYLDCLFNPMVLEEKNVFRQEGIRFNEQDGHLVPFGIVFNEMKTYYTNLDNIEGNAINTYIRDDFYRHDSGGNPKDILNLKYDEFIEFYKKYYHPSNLCAVFYGDIDTDEHLETLERFISRFEKNDYIQSIKFTEQKLRDKGESYNASFQGKIEDGCSYTLSFLLPQLKSYKEVVKMIILKSLLLDYSASPLKLALIKSGLGQDLSSNSGISIGSYLQTNPIFTVGLKGVSKENVAKVERIIEDELAKIYKDGFEEEFLQTILKSAEFGIKEAFSLRPRGVNFGVGILDCMIKERDLFEFLKFEDCLTEIKKEVLQNKRVFEELLKERLLDNKHTLKLTLHPDEEYLLKQEEEEKRFLKEKKESLSESELEELKSEFREFEEYQKKDLKYEFEKLKKEDFESPKWKAQQDFIGEIEGVKLIANTNGITYLKLAFDISHIVNENNVDFISLFTSFFTQLGTTYTDYGSLEKKISKYGSLFANVLSIKEKNGKDKLYFAINAKFLKEDARNMLDILKEIISDIDVENEERLEELLKEEYSRYKEEIEASPYKFIYSRVLQPFSKVFALKDRMEGITGYLSFKTIKNNIKIFKEKFKELSTLIFIKTKVLYEICSESTEYDLAKDELSKFLKFLKDRGDIQDSEIYDLHKDSLDFEVYDIKSKVAFDAVSFKLSQPWTKESLNEGLLIKIMGSDYLLNEIRIKGGAYGAFANSWVNIGVGVFGSYRDPNINLTYDTYEKVFDYYKNTNMSEEDLERLVIPHIASFNKPLSPREEARRYFEYFLAKIKKEDFYMEHEELCKITVKDIKEAADRLKNSYESINFKVCFAGEELIKKELKEKKTKLIEIF